MAPSYISRMYKRKRIVEEEGYEIMLNLTVRHAEGIDRETTNPAGDKRIYRVLGWVIPGEEFLTPEAEGLPNPEWNRKYRIALGQPMSCRYLNLEVVRTRSRSDPGTSTGIALVGRTRIPLPKDVNYKVGGRYGLVVPKGLGCIGEGHITITMETKRMENMNYYHC